jgi:hypothetical protein
MVLHLLADGAVDLTFQVAGEQRHDVGTLRRGRRARGGAAEQGCYLLPHGNARAVQPALHGVHADPQDRGDLRGRQSLDVAEDEHLPLPGLQGVDGRREGGVDPRPRLLTGRRIREVLMTTLPGASSDREWARICRGVVAGAEAADDRESQVVTAASP